MINTTISLSSRKDQLLKLCVAGGTPSSAFLDPRTITSLLVSYMSQNVVRYVLQREDAITIYSRWLETRPCLNFWDTKRKKCLKQYRVQYCILGPKTMRGLGIRPVSTPVSSVSKKHPLYLLFEICLLYFGKWPHYRKYVLL